MYLLLTILFTDWKEKKRLIINILQVIRTHSKINTE
jgi:hypothetical protein